jgi:regulator of nucleoside diphosphate kinase
MNSRVLFEDVESGEELEVTLVYPRNADFDQRRISVLAPVGTALLGLAVGESIVWPTPGGTDRRLRVTRLSYQPEAAGDPDA